MKDETTIGDPVDRREGDPIPASRSYLFVGFTALVVYFMLMSDIVGNIGALLALMIAASGLIARWVISPGLFLILTTYFLYDPHCDLFQLTRTKFSAHRQAEFRHFGLSELLLTVSVLVYLMSQFRLLSLVHKGMPEDPPPRRKGQPESEPPRRPVKLFADREIGQMLSLAPICVLVGLLIWFVVEQFETTENLGGKWGVERPFARLMLFSWVFITGALVLGVVFRYIAFRRMSRHEARLMLQDIFWRETRREQERIHRWRRWYKKRHSSREPGARS